MNVAQTVLRSIQILQKCGVPTPDVDARAIIGHHLGINRNELFLHQDEKINSLKAFLIKRNIRRRSRFEPVAFILGYKDFFKDRFAVSRKTLIPRADTEHLLYAVQNTGKVFQDILDIGTGTGAIAVSLSRIFPQARIHAMDLDISTAKKNVRLLNINNVKLIRADFLKMKFPKDSFYDLIISNPPYLSDEDLVDLEKGASLYEPLRSFYGGKDGLDFYRKIAPFAVHHLKQEGMIVLEVDRKWLKVKEIFVNNGFNKIEVFKDYNDLERAMVIAKE